MSYWSIVIIDFLVGWIIGVISAWNRKVMFFILLTMISLMIISYAFLKSNGVEVYDDFEALSFFIGVASTIFGIKCGETSYEVAFK